VSARYFDIFGIQAERGRTFLPDEDQRGKDRVVVLSHALWVNQFGADPSIVNRTILLENEVRASSATSLTRTRDGASSRSGTGTRS
jgi:putative ABC transport system permease protein